MPDFYLSADKEHSNLNINGIDDSQNPYFSYYIKQGNLEDYSDVELCNILNSFFKITATINDSEHLRFSVNKSKQATSKKSNAVTASDLKEIYSSSTIPEGKTADSIVPSELIPDNPRT